MGMLRRRFLVATGMLLGLQLLGSSAALLSWRQVVRAVEDEQALALWREHVTGFGGAVREQYVHQAHSFIEGAPTHLDHHETVAAEAARRLDLLEDLPVPEGPARLARLRARYEEFGSAFSAEAIPALVSGTLDRPQATALHARCEGLAQAVEADVRSITADLDLGQADARSRAARAVTRAWWITAALLLVGLGLVLVVTRRLARAVLAPLEALRSATARFAEGDPTARVALPAPPAPDDEIGGLSVAFNGMVERVAGAEDRRVRAERLAALGEMSAAVAHELLNPLTVILGATAEPAVKAEAEHATRVVRGLLGFARPGEELPVAVDLARAARETVERLGPLADAAGVELVASGASAPRTLSPSAVRQILDNLVRNAIEASPAGAVVEVVVTEADLCVRDRGPGLPEAVRARLYEPFATGRPAGTGLGLAVAARIARALGGELGHADRPGGGTVATWRFGGSHG